MKCDSSEMSEEQRSIGLEDLLETGTSALYMYMYTVTMTTRLYFQTAHGMMK